jgi:membrane protein YqaA with SNARE-associated domain
MDAASVGLWGLFTSAFLSATLMFIALGKIARYTVVLFVAREALA